MTAVTSKKFCLLFLCLGMTVSSLEAQIRTVTARDALDQVRMRFGPESVGFIAELKATGGQPQPLQWDIVAHDPNSPGLLHHFRASGGVVQDGGPDSRRYPNDVPNGFFTLSDINVDSVAAFTIAEAEARKARMGFDSCDYFLRLREFSLETVWKLELVDANHRIVGAVFISGANGQVLRTVWVQRDSISGFPVFIDSLNPQARSYTGITDGESPIPQTFPGDSGIVELTNPSFSQQGPAPFTPISPDGIARQIPEQNPMPSRSGGIFKEFPTEGGGGSLTTIPAPPAPNGNPLVPSEQPMNIPEPDSLINPIDPVISGPAPPINVPNTGGSSARIPPPPVPR